MFRHAILKSSTFIIAVLFVLAPIQASEDHTFVGIKQDDGLAHARKDDSSVKNVTILSFMKEEINSSANGTAPSSVILFDKEEGLETDITNILKEQVNRQINDILNNKPITSENYPIQLREVYFLLSYEYCNLYQAEQDVLRKNRLKTLLDQFTQFSKRFESPLSSLLYGYGDVDLGHAMNAIIHDEVYLEDILLSIHKARKRLKNLKNKEQFFPLSYCLYGCFLADGLWQADSDNTKICKKILEDSRQTVDEFEAKKKTSDTCGEHAEAQQKRLLLVTYFKSWIDQIGQKISS